MVGNKNILLENLDSNSKSKLSARFSADSFVYGVFNESNDLIHATAYHEGYDFDTVYAEIDALNIQELIFNFTTSPFFHTPFEDDALIHQMPNFYGKSILKDKVNKFDVYTVFGVDRPFFDFVNRFQNTKVTHISNLLVDVKVEDYDDCLVAFFEKEILHLSYTDENGLKFYNQYRCSKDNDYLYWIAAVYETLELKRKETPLALAGDIVDNWDLFTFISKYIPLTKLVRPEIVKDGTRSSNNKEQLLFDLYQSLLCV